MEGADRAEEAEEDVGDATGEEVLLLLGESRVLNRFSKPFSLVVLSTVSVCCA